MRGNPTRHIPPQYRWALLAMVLAIVAYRVRMTPIDPARVQAYRVAAGRYREYAGAYSARGQNVSFSTCYGDLWDGYTNKVMDDFAEKTHDAAYRAERAAKYDTLRQEYERAASDPRQYHLSVDPPTWP